MKGKVENVSLLYYVKPIMIFLGTFPHQLLNFNEKAYNFYKYIFQGTFFIFLVFLYMEVPNLQGPMDKMFQNISILFTYCIMYIKGLVCMSKNMSGLIFDMLTFESKIKTTGNDEDFEIYSSIVKRSKMVQIFYIILTYLTGIAFFQEAIKHAVSSDEIRFNSTMEAHLSLPYAMWLPLDENKHYLLALAIQSCCALLAINYYCFVQCVLVILSLNITLRLKLLGNSLKHIKISNRSSEDEETFDNVEEDIIFCIKEHIDIIENCSILNNTIKYLMLLEFLLSSAQISLALVLLTTTDETNVKVFSLIYLFQLLTQLLILYWHGDEIREKSIAICDILYDLPWYDYSKNIKTNIQIMMIRSQKPLSLTVGPFGELSLTMAVKIIKAAYTYVMFMKQVYEEK